MSAGSPPPPDPWRELARRRVERFAALYIAVAFALVEAALMILPTMQAPEWAFRFVLGVLVIGFPPALVLAWRYDVTAGGIVKTPEHGPAEGETTHHPWRWLIGVVLAAGIGVAIEIAR